MMSLAIALHVLSAIIWVGGMFLVYVCLRPVAVAQLQPPQRLPFLEAVLGRFFVWVWVAVVVLPVTGFWMAISAFGEVPAWPLYVQFMMGLGLIMILLYLHLFFAPWRRMREALAAMDLAAAGRQLDRIRRIVAINLALGILVAMAGSGGRYF